MTMLLVCVVASWGTDWIREEIIIRYLSMLNSYNYIQIYTFLMANKGIQI